MKFILTYIFVLIGLIGSAQSYKLSLNGTVDFDQTETAFPPQKFTRKIPVPGLIDLAVPKIDQYDLYFSGQHQPRYNWYKFTFQVPKGYEEKFAILKLLKARYNTQIILNGHDCGTYMQCSVPIDSDLTPFLKKGENELLIRLGERAWLPKEAATGFDREKYSDIPGIWDDIWIEFGAPIQIHRALILPNLKEGKITVKVNLENYARILERNMEYSEIEYTMSTEIREKISKNIVASFRNGKGKIQCQQSKILEYEASINSPKSWSPDDPFLYEIVINIKSRRKFYTNYGNTESLKPLNNQSWVGDYDEEVFTFGMRDFESVGKSFHLNGQQVNLFGSTITLNRFFEDRDRHHLPWDREWVENLMVNIPKAMRWNFFRVSIGLLPKFWYELADKHGIMIQNEYLMWNLRGRPSQYEVEYTDWIWSDGNHPSIIIWDALNEQKQDYIGNVLIPKLKELDPTRIWDVGFMKREDVSKLEMEEIHWYPLAHGWWVTDDWVKENIPAFRFGKLHKKYGGISQFMEASTPIITNEFGWLWQDRSGTRSGIRTFGNFVKEDITPYKKNYESFEPNGKQLYENRDTYEYFLGKGASAKDRWAFQAYMLAIESEIIRSTRESDGIATFAYLSNNHGYTGDWFKGDIKNLEPSQALLVQYHTCRPFAVFVDEQDARYLKDPEYFDANSSFILHLLAVNDSGKMKKGNLKVKLVDAKGKIVFEMKKDIELAAFWQNGISIPLELPKEGGYMILSELYEDGVDDIPQVSRRYIQVGSGNVDFLDYEYLMPKGV